MASTQRQAIRRVVVALHDVAPPFEAAIRMQIELLAAIGVRRLALMVTPNWHGVYPLDASPTFVALLRAQVAAGSQIVLHGFTHQPYQGRSFRGSWLSQTRARLFAADTAEFLTLSTAEAEAALRRGLDCFECIGLPRPTMFCAPGWLHNAAAETALRRTGFRYLLDMFALCDLLTQRRIWAPAVGYMGAAAGQELGVQALNEIVQRTALRSATVASVYLHPQRHPTGSSVQRRLADLEVMVRRDGWRTATYAEVCDDDGASDASDASDADDARASAP